MTAEIKAPGNGAEGGEGLSGTILVEAALPLGCPPEKLIAIAKEGGEEVLTLPRFLKGERLSPTTVLCPEIATETRSLRETSIAGGIMSLLKAGIVFRPDQQEDTYLLVGRVPVDLSGPGTYHTQWLMREVFDNGCSPAYFCPQNFQEGPARLGMRVESDFLAELGGRTPPFFSGPEWDGLIREIDRVLRQTVVDLCWTEAVRGNDYY